MYDREELRSFAHEAIQCLLSYNVERFEAFLYLTNRLELCMASYELQCAIFDQDSIGYIRHHEMYKKLEESRREQDFSNRV
jgi:hypothetical protein